MFSSEGRRLQGRLREEMPAGSRELQSDSSQEGRTKKKKMRCKNGPARSF
jgi:hypothetical protein